MAKKAAESVSQSVVTQDEQKQLGLTSVVAKKLSPSEKKSVKKERERKKQGRVKKKATVSQWSSEAPVRPQQPSLQQLAGGFTRPR